MKKEAWKQVKGFPGYKVSDLGRVKNKAGRVLKQYHHSGKAQDNTFNSLENY